MKYTRNDFLKTAGLGLAASVMPISFNKLVAQNPVNSKPERLKLGLASYTLHKFNLDDTIKILQRLELKEVSLKDMHLPFDATAAQLQEMTSKVRQAGINLYGVGVIYMKSEQEIDRAFAYAKNAGVKMIVGVPNHELLPYTEKKVKEYDIRVAIHNHGPGDKVYPSPESVYEKIKGLDKRIGLCIDIGHTQRIGLDPIKDTLRFADRLYDVHIKDVTGSTEKDTPTEIGRGVIDIPGFLRALLKIKYAGSVSMEYEKNANDPVPGLAESVGYTRGVLRLI
ncbi:sugar phosphate isomerase/epimerase family protein [Adhaeribacter radiodurans]|uniref:Sugar phosphate isomerase/epimerase n=1 Tax=Adhaeribacter radiodurans TaxID=2745197 RepID=A0A7L7LDP1_9BACT|nr:sugar phosphate isomerase/epimerase family protein [Adhaeribacter radiodurans]QMU30655.1 sugar phosphate isomerase/epimerase [Adhaeribacter radiodurans]